MSAGELPPVPDPSGQPRPPTAPRVVGPWEGERHRLKVAHHQVADRLYVASTGQGPPLLESARAGRPPGRWGTAALEAAYTVLPITLVGAIALWFIVEDRMQAYLFLAVAVAVTGALFFWRNASDPTIVLLAGARAVAEVDTDGEGPDLPLYELSSIGVTDSRRGLALRLVGPDKQRLTLPFGLLEANQQLWDLVYNGVRHSEAAGAEIDARTRQLLGLPQRGPEINA
jgi:HAMP domain-containing protein